MLNIAKNMLRGDKSVAIKRGHNTALLVMPGFGTFKTRWDAFAHGFTQLGPYDIYLPDIFRRQSIDTCAAALGAFIHEHQLERYETLHVFNYILGAWVFNRYVNANPLPNLSRVIYDRSPVQDLAPRAIVENIPLGPRVVVGRALADLAYAPYEPLQQPGVTVGLMIENGVVGTMRPFRQWVLAQRPLTWDVAQFNQPHDDYCYMPLDHDGMYHFYDVFTEQVGHFFKHGHFMESARRTPYVSDPFTQPVHHRMANEA